MTPQLLKVQDLQVSFQTLEGITRAVVDVGFTVDPRETLGIVGESGGGKSVVSLSIMRLIPNPPGRITKGCIRFDGRDLLQLAMTEMRAVRGNEIAMIFQEPMTSLNPLHTCGKQIREPIILHQNTSKKQAVAMAVNLLAQVGIPSPNRVARMYPHQISGGMRQRVMIAMALACMPKLLIADEPTTALDVTIEAQILDLIKTLKEEINAGIILISHNLALVAEVCDRVLVMYTGRVVEEAPVRSLIENPHHPYTRGLLSSIPKITGKKVRLQPIDGMVPSPFRMPGGCSFHPRCADVMDICPQEIPAMIRLDNNHGVRCWKYA